MDALQNLSTSLWMEILGFPLLLCCLVVFLNAGHREYSKNALRNTVTTLCVYGFNAVIIILLAPDVGETATTIYHRLNLPVLDPGIWDAVPWVLVALVAFLAADFSDYWIHRLMHTKWFWPPHAAHHSDTHVNAFTTYRIHLLETSLMATSYVVLLTWLQLPGQLPLVAVGGLLFNMYVHTDLPYTHGPLKYVLASPLFHRWHHADTPKAHGKNLANIFPFYDLMFGTYYDVKTTITEPMGATSSNIEDIDPWKIYSYPFVAWSRMLKAAAQQAFAKPVDLANPETDVRAMAVSSRSRDRVDQDNRE